MEKRIRLKYSLYILSACVFMLCGFFCSHIRAEANTECEHFLMGEFDNKQYLYTTENGELKTKGKSLKVGQNAYWTVYGETFVNESGYWKSTADSGSPYYNHKVLATEKKDGTYGPSDGQNYGAWSDIRIFRVCCTNPNCIYGNPAEPVYLKDVVGYRLLVSNKLPDAVYGQNTVTGSQSYLYPVTDGYGNSINGGLTGGSGARLHCMTGTDRVDQTTAQMYWDDASHSTGGLGTAKPSVLQMTDNLVAIGTWLKIDNNKYSIEKENIYCTGNKNYDGMDTAYEYGTKYILYVHTEEGVKSVTVNGNEYGFTKSNHRIEVYGGAPIRIDVTMDNGYTFTDWRYWKQSDGSGEGYWKEKETTFTMPYYNYCIQACAAVDSYTQTTRLCYQEADGTYGDYATKDTKSVKAGSTYSWTYAPTGTEALQYKPTSVSYTVTKAQTNQLKADRKEYTLTLKSNGGIRGGTTADYSYTKRWGVEDDYSNPTKTGYDFTGWKFTSPSNATDKGWSTRDKDATTYITYGWCDATATAQWKVVNYSITYNLNGGTVSKANPTSYNIETADFALNNPTKTGYTFTGWTGSNGTTPTINVTIKKGSTGNKSYTANWQINQYNLTIKAGTGIKSVSGGGKFDYNSKHKIGAVVKPGYTWKNWTGYKETATKNYEVTIPAKDITLTANATPNPDTPYKVEHYLQNVNDNNYTLHETENKKGTTDTKVTPSVKTYEGFTSPATQTVNIDGDGSRVVKYYYDRNYYTVTLNKGSYISGVTATGTKNSGGGFKYGTEVTIDATVFADTSEWDYSWGKWTGYKETTTKKCSFIIPAKDVTLTATATRRDIIGPAVTMTQSPENWTNGEVVITAVATDRPTTDVKPEDNVGLPDAPYSWQDESSYGTGNTLTVSENGTYTVYVRDKNGNVTGASHTVGNIDRIKPVIGGLENFMEAFEQGNTTVTLTFQDEASGIDRAEVTVKNTANGEEKTYHLTAGGELEKNLVISIYENIPVYAGLLETGTLQITAQVWDRAGNSGTDTRDETGIGLKTRLTSMLEPHDPVFMSGESGTLEIETRGYIDTLKVEFPDEIRWESYMKWNDSLTNDKSFHTYLYEEPEYKQTENVTFMIPLYTEEKEYTITITAIKDGAVVKTATEVFTVQGTILDEIRTRVR